MDFIDSTGLGVFVGALKRAREGGGGIELRGLKPSARKVFEITGLSSAFTIAAKQPSGAVAGSRLRVLSGPALPYGS